MIKTFFFTVLLNLATLINAQQEIPLYAEVPNSREAPNQEEIVLNPEVDTLIYKVSVPSLTIYLPSKGSVGSAVIICPGGGYHVLLINREGRKIARAFNKYGVAAFVLKYRLPDDRVMIDKSIGPLQDAQRAIQIIRQRAGEWHIDPQKIGIMGFSAGGHLAATAGTHFEHSLIDNKMGTSLRPDFMILIYPVISFTDSIGHIGSRENLLGKSPTLEQIQFFSNEKQVSKSTPPAFITHGGDDSVVPIANSLSFYNQLRKNSIPAELHVYSSGEHGYLKQPPFEEWFGRCCYWMKSNGWL
jgi:acetyl esterase/lipase